MKCWVKMKATDIVYEDTFEIKGENIEAELKAEIAKILSIEHTRIIEYKKIL